MSEARVWTIDIAFTASEDHTRADAPAQSAGASLWNDAVRPIPNEPLRR